MPKDEDTRPCKHKSCKGVQIFHTKAVVPGEREGREKWGKPTKTSPAWVCDTDYEHFDTISVLTQP